MCADKGLRKNQVYILILKINIAKMLDLTRSDEVWWNVKDEFNPVLTFFMLFKSQVQYNPSII